MYGYLYRISHGPLSCGMKEHRLSTSMDKLVTNFFTSDWVEGRPLTNHLLPLFSEFRILLIRRAPFIIMMSTSTKLSCPSFPCFTNFERSFDRPMVSSVEMITQSKSANEIFCSVHKSNTYRRPLSNRNKPGRLHAWALIYLSHSARWQHLVSDQGKLRSHRW